MDNQTNMNNYQNKKNAIFNRNMSRLEKKTLAGINPGKKKHGCVSQMGLIGKDGMHLRSMVVLRSINS